MTAFYEDSTLSYFEKKYILRWNISRYWTPSIYQKPRTFFFERALKLRENGIIGVDVNGQLGG